MTQAFAFQDFSGGITDHVIDGPTNTAEKMDNIVLNQNRKPVSRAGSSIYRSSADQIPAGGVRINALIDFQDTIITQAGTALYPMDQSFGSDTKSAYSTLLGPSSGQPFDAGNNTTTRYSWSKWNDHLMMGNDAYADPVKVYKDGNGSFQVRTAGLPEVDDGDVTITESHAGSSTSYLYAVLYFYEYTVGTVTFQDFGPTTLFAATELDDAIGTNGREVEIDLSGVDITADGSNYDTAVPVEAVPNVNNRGLKFYIYRTSNNGSTYYLVDSVNYSDKATAYTDTTTDASLLTSTTLYTTGGDLANDKPPAAKYVHVVNEICYYANIQLTDGSTHKNRIYQSIALDPDSVPATFFKEVEEEITGVSSINGSVIIFCKSSMYRLEGQLGATGAGSVVTQRISSSVGCVSNNSIVSTSDGIFFAGQDGFYVTDGFKTFKITEHLNEFYKGIVNTDQKALNINGVLDELNRRVYWGIQTDDSSPDNDTWLIMDLKFGIIPTSVFTTASGGESFRPTASLYFDQDILRGDSRGYVFKHSSEYYSDPVVDVSTDSKNWNTQPVIYNYWSTSTSLGNPTIAKWIPKITVDLQNETDINVQLISNTDNTHLVNDLTPIRYKNNIVWGEDQDIVWGSTDEIRWLQAETIQSKRRMPAKHLRSFYKQIRMTNAYAIINNSDTLGQAVVVTDDNTDTATVTLSSIAITTGVNDSIDFIENGDTIELTATMAQGTGEYGQDSDPHATICGAVKTALQNASSNGATYTVTYDTQTNLFTIAGSGGTFTSIQILGATGTNLATSFLSEIGFTTDTSDAASVEGDTQVVVYKWLSEPLKRTIKIETGINDSIDFKEDAGTEERKTLDPGDYEYGSDSTPYAGLCAEIKDKLETGAAGNTYTVSFQPDLYKFTIATSGTSVQVLPVTGTNTATSFWHDIGFIYDSDVAASITGSEEVIIRKNDVEPVGYFLSFDTDADGVYETDIEVIERSTDTVLTLQVIPDKNQLPAAELSSEALPSGTYPWVLKGIKKNEYFHLLSYALHYSPLTPTQTPYQGADGSNA